MVKFSREYEASIIPEWKAAFVDYKGLKKLVKRIKIARRDRDARSTSNDHDDATTTSYGFSVLDPVRALASHFNNATPPASPEGGSDDDALRTLESDSGELVRATDKHEQEFVERADEELEKVNKFYAAQEADMLARGDALIEQLRILADVKRILADHAAASSRRGRARLARTGGNSSPPVELQQARVAEGAAVAEEVMAALERNGVSFVGGGLGKAKKDGSGKQLMGRAALLQLPATVRIDIPPTSPGRAALKVWEELVNVLRKDGADPAAAFVHRKKVQHAEKSIRDAFLALYRGLDLLKKFSSLNVKAFTKILKKFVKVLDLLCTQNPDTHTLTLCCAVCTKPRNSFSALQQVSEQHRKGDLFSEKVKRSPFSSSDKACSQAHLCPCSSYTRMFALISLHVFLYGCNLSMWKGTRINHNFIFDFSSSTALTHRDAFLMSASIMCTVVAALVVNLFLRNAGATYANALPGALLLLSAGVLFCPFNIFYRSTRFCFMRVMRNIVLSPFYKLYWDFVMDWGFLNSKSKNFWLRDQLILKNKSIYYASMMLNLVLRLAWAESVMKLRLGMVESRLLDFSLASLEIIRRGHWNFYRLENEHLNNAGKFRAVKTVPLPFRELETD
ncbi:Phosphate transporter PHO1-2 [Zea mays]|uniref:Phosphate transporter PHO1-2 n=1 Tax=Zea mays TaxID=4577 RepID=A0A3L6ENH1_MAIZE|nr:Phosphate transporter PHO1-2 [Zea mays]